MSNCQVPCTKETTPDFSLHGKPHLAALIDQTARKLGKLLQRSFTAKPNSTFFGSYHQELSLKGHVLMRLISKAEQNLRSCHIRI